MLTIIVNIALKREGEGRTLDEFDDFIDKYASFNIFCE
jgi:hypothetical protein